MKHVFLSYQFGAQDRDIVDLVDRLLYSHGLEVVRGRRTAGMPVDDAIRERIRSCDALVAVLTRDDAGGNGPSNWVRDELVFAQNIDLPAIGLLETGVELPGGLGTQNREYPPLSRENPAEAIVALSETLHLWKKLKVKLQLQPDEIATTLGSNIDHARVEYRLSREGQVSDWSEGSLSDEGYGMFAYIEPKSTNDLIQLRIKHNGSQWSAKAIHQWVKVDLDEERGG